MGGLLRDLRFALRMMVKSPAVTAVAVASLAVGLAANVTIFSVVNSIFFKGIQAEKPEELVSVFGTDAKQAPDGPMPLSRLNFEDYRDRNQVLSGLVNIAFLGANLQQGDGEPRSLFMHAVSGSRPPAPSSRPLARPWSRSTRWRTPAATSA